MRKKKPKTTDQTKTPGTQKTNGKDSNTLAGRKVSLGDDAKARNVKPRTISKPSKYLPILVEMENRLDSGEKLTLTKYAHELNIPVTTLVEGLKTARKQSQSLSAQQRTAIIESTNRNILNTAHSGATLRK